MKNNQPLNAQAVKDARFADRGLPLYHTEWHDKDGRVTRKGFLAGCIERYEVNGRAGVTVMIKLVQDQFDNAAKYFYVVECSDHLSLWGKLSLAHQERDIDLGMYTSFSIKDARKACTQFRQGKLRKNGIFQ